MYTNHHMSSKPRTTLQSDCIAELSDSIYTAIKTKTQEVHSVFFNVIQSVLVVQNSPKKKN